MEAEAAEALSGSQGEHRFRVPMRSGSYVCLSPSNAILMVSCDQGLMHVLSLQRSRCILATNGKTSI